MNIREFQENGIRGVAISFGERGADFWEDGEITEWSEKSMMCVQEMSHKTCIPYIAERKISEAMEKASEILGVEFDWTIL